MTTAIAATSARCSSATTRRRYPYDTPEVIPHDQWRFARAEAGGGGETQSVERAVVPSERHIFLPAGFQPGWIYELVYTAKDPLVHGLGHVAVRDFISFLKYDRSDANPLHGIEKAYAWGRSQTGRYVAAITATARELAARGLMLEEDVARCTETAADWGRPRHDVSLE